MSLRSIDFPSYNPNGSADLMARALEHHSKRMAERRNKDVGLDLYNTYNSFIEEGKRPDFIREALRKAMLENQESTIKNQYLEPGLQEELAKQRLGNQESTIRNQYLEPGLQEQLSQSMLKTQSDRVEGQFKPEELRAKLANALLLPAHTQAQTNLLQAQASNIPEQNKLKLAALLSGKEKQASMEDRAAKARFIRSLSTPQMQQLIAGNPEIAKKVAQTLSTINSEFPGADRGNAVSLSDKDIESMRSRTSDLLTKKTATAQILNQRQYAVVLDKLFDEGSALMPSVTQYAGIRGKSQLAADKALAATGKKSNPRYSDYLNFTNVVAPNTANEMRRVLGGQATDYESKVMNNLANPAFWSSNPKLAMEQWNFMKNMFKNKISPSLTTGLSEAVEKLKGGDMNSMDETNALDNEGYTEDDLEGILI